MKRLLLAASAVATLVGAATCLRVIHDTQTIIIYPDLGTPPLDLSWTPPDLTPDIHAQALYVLDLSRASANLAPYYAAAIEGLQVAFAERHVFVDEWAVLPSSGPPGKPPEFVFGGNNGLLGPNIGQLAPALSQAAGTGFYDAGGGAGAELANLASIGQRLDSATLPPGLNNGNSAPAFSSPMDFFLVVVVQPVRRRCAYDDANCALGGQAPGSYLTALDMYGATAWMKMVGQRPRPKLARFLFITTSEEESAQQFAARCTGVPGFPRTLLDVMEPSPVPYYKPLADALGVAGTEAWRVDLCDLLGASGKPLLLAQAARLGHR